ncbi:MAG: tetratricopeptide repeat protein [Dehalococcoidia bacterium]|nr:tetratricopeptide repeat protein [Dehalococcoidia bacterium]
MGLIEYNQQRWAEALDRFQQAATWDPKYAPALYFRGLAHLKLGQ